MSEALSVSIRAYGDGPLCLEWAQRAFALEAENAELLAACNLASIYVVQGSGGLNTNPDLAAANQILCAALSRREADNETAV